MQSLRQTALRSARRMRAPQPLQAIQCRYASEHPPEPPISDEDMRIIAQEANKLAATGGGGRVSQKRLEQLQRQLEEHARAREEEKKAHDAPKAPPPPPNNESFGSGFYIALASVPITLALYKFSQSDVEGSQITRYIFDKYHEFGSEFNARNDLHTQAMEQAAADRVLFLTESNQNVRYVDHRFPELVDHHSPWNVPAGQGSTDMTALIEKFKKDATAQQDEKLRQLRENKIPREQDYNALSKVTPSAVDS